MKGRVLRFFLLYFGAFGCIDTTRGERRCELTATYNKHFLHETMLSVYGRWSIRESQKVKPIQLSDLNPQSLTLEQALEKISV